VRLLSNLISRDAQLRNRCSETLPLQPIYLAAIMSVTETPTLEQVLLPLVDFGRFLHSTSSERYEVAAQLGAAFRTAGFVYLTNYGTPQDISCSLPTNLGQYIMTHAWPWIQVFRQLSCLLA